MCYTEKSVFSVFMCGCVDVAGAAWWLLLMAVSCCTLTLTPKSETPADLQQLNIKDFLQLCH